MRTSDINVGCTYHDGKQGLREVVAKEGLYGDVTYKILAAKQSQAWNDNAGSMVSVIESTSKMSLDGFAKWAKGEVPTAEIESYRQRLMAAKLKLSVGELAFMKLLQQERVPAKPGVMVSVDQAEGRATSGLQKNGLLILHSQEAELTALGAAWLSIYAFSGKE